MPRFTWAIGKLEALPGFLVFISAKLHCDKISILFPSCSPTYVIPLKYPKSPSTASVTTILLALKPIPSNTKLLSARVAGVVILILLVPVTTEALAKVVPPKVILAMPVLSASNWTV